MDLSVYNNNNNNNVIYVMQDLTATNALVWLQVAAESSKFC